MRRATLAIGLALCLLIEALPSVAHSAEPEQYFASIFLDNKKIGQVQVRFTRGETGEIEDLRVRASLSLLRVSLYEFAHDLQQTWRDGQLQKMQGRADDNGKIYDARVNREASDYSGSVNGKATKLPLEAFPSSIWHHGIVDHPLLFSEMDLRLMHVAIAEADETIKLHGNNIFTKRFTFSGDFVATVWFDNARDFVMAEYEVEGRKVKVTRDAPAESPKPTGLSPTRANSRAAKKTTVPLSSATCVSGSKPCSPFRRSNPSASRWHLAMPHHLALHVLDHEHAALAVNVQSHVLHWAAPLSAYWDAFR
jgi:Family of unknown function (DUF6134)